MTSNRTTNVDRLSALCTRPNEVRVVDCSYLQRNFSECTDHDASIIQQTSDNFSLNAEQDRAFRIVANHATMSTPSQLKMHLGGMAGTGKSQVIKALTHFFAMRNESHRMIALAPTGSAAALLGGYTYHSVLGIRDGGASTSAAIARIRARLEGVDYIFIDEVSMLSCHDLYNVCSQL
ncbi:hypothetical protein BV22DRAFT_1024132, partial [Leucogyrophana mollusca]